MSSSAPIEGASAAACGAGPAPCPLDPRREHADPLAECDAPLVVDRQRIIHSAAFRRLEYKTQVFLAVEADNFRTRLTHTLEVADLARLIATRLGLSADLAEVAALAHDLGHPPFGHAGERALDACMAAAGGFEHNAHSLRVVEYLEHPYPEFRGLNLTRAVRECLAKHCTQFDRPGSHPLQDGRPPPLEGQVAALADRLAYGLHDLQDGVYSGLLNPAELSETALWREALPRPAPPAERMLGALRPIIDRIQRMLVEDVVEYSRPHVRPHGPSGLLAAAATCSAAQSDTHAARIAAATSNSSAGSTGGSSTASMARTKNDPMENSASNSTGGSTIGSAATSTVGSIAGSASGGAAGRAAIGLSDSAETRLRELEAFLLARLYRHHHLVRMDAKARRILRAVFDEYVAQPGLMPRRYSQRVDEQGVQRVAADYLAGMTDRYCLAEHARLFDPNFHT